MAGFMILFLMVVVLGMLLYAHYGKNLKRKYTPPRQTVTKSRIPKTKQTQLEPLVIDIADTWVKCEVQMERGLRDIPITTLHFSFFDASDNKVLSKRYGEKESVAYQRQLSKILGTHGFEMTENSGYREWVKYIYIRTPESTA